MPLLVVAATSADTVINPILGYTRIAILNPVGASARISYHQGSAGPANAQPSPDTGAPSLAAGETIVLNFSRPVYLNAPANAGGSVNWTGLE